MRTFDDIRRDNPDIILASAQIDGMVEVLAATINNVAGIKVKTSARRSWLYESYGTIERGIVFLADSSVAALRKSLAASDSLDTIAETLQGALHGQD